MWSVRKRSMLLLGRASGAGEDPYRQIFGNPPVEVLDSLVEKSARYFHEWEQELLTTDQIPVN